MKVKNLKWLLLTAALIFSAQALAADSDGDGVVDTVSGDGFETGNFSALPWVTGAGQQAWSVVSGGKTGNYSARQYPSTLTISYLSLTLDFPAATNISFYYKQVGTGNIAGSFLVDGIKKATLDVRSWRLVSVPVSAGVHTLRWQSNAGVSQVTDIYIDDLGFGVAVPLDKFPLNPAASSDSDNDGFPDSWNSSCDATCKANSGLTPDNCPTISNADQLNTDGDAQGNVCDADDDNDGVTDASDKFPLDPTESVDTDNDGIGNNADTDDDNDGVVDGSDNCPLNSNADQADTDGDGLWDACTDADDDNDGVTDASDKFPLDPTETVDTDNDGIGNNADTDDDNDAVADVSDNCPLNSNADQLNTDGDVQGNVCDADDDNDSVADASDKFPLNPAASSDSDNDGLPGSWNGSCDATCQANSGLTLDNCPSNYNPDQADTDGDGLPDACTDTDDDNDGVVDGSDKFPLNPAASSDSDNDGYPGSWRPTCDTTCQANSGLTLDNCPTTYTASQLNADGDAQGDACDTDDDNDGVQDPADNCSWIANVSQLNQDGDVDGDACDGMPLIYSGPQQIAAGGAHTCVLTAAGGVKCWGYNNYGKLGDGTNINRYTPVDVIGLGGGVSAIAAGLYHTCALTLGGSVKCWGKNSGTGAGALGDGTNIDRYTPVDVSGLTGGVSAIAVGLAHTCVLTAAGGVKCWGRNDYGQLGDGSSSIRYTPVDVIGLGGGVSAITAGRYHTCALAFGGGVKCWGNNPWGELGDGTTINRSTPVDVAGLSSGVKAIVAGSQRTCALTLGGGVKCWGENDYGQLGDNTTTQRVTAVDVAGLSSGVSAITTGIIHTCAITTAGGVKCWGGNNYGQLGDNTTTDRYSPIDVSGLTGGVSAIAAGNAHACVITTAGGVKCWGSNGAGELGDGTTIQRTMPVSVIWYGGDTDGDGYGDVNDAFPLDASEWLDTDNDGIGNNADTDDDNDGVLDINDAFPLNAAEWLDTDNDGTGNNADTDDDNDSYADTLDLYPLNANKWQADVRHDTDIDRDSDVLIRSASTGAWTRYSVQNGAVVGSGAINAYVSSSVQYVAQLDANGDGDADILTRNTSTGAWYLHQVQSGAVTGTTPIYLYANLDQQFIGAGDFNNDGVDDVMLRSASAGYYTVFLLANHGVSSAVYYNSWTSAQSVPQGIGDFDGDGMDDLLVRRTSDNLYYIFKTTNGSTFSNSCACNIWANPDWAFQFAGDTNKDGIDDIVIRGTGASADGKWWAFRMNNFVSSSYSNLNLFINKTAITVGAVGDYNGDGTIDVLTRVNNSTTYISPIVNGTVTGNYWLYNFTSDQVIGK